MLNEDSAQATATPNSSLNTQSTFGKSPTDKRLEVQLRLSQLQLKQKLTEGERIELQMLLKWKYTTEIRYPAKKNDGPFFDKINELNDLLVDNIAEHAKCRIQMGGPIERTEQEKVRHQRATELDQERELYRKERADKRIGDALRGLSSAEIVDLDEVDKHALKYLESRLEEFCSKEGEYSRWQLDGRR